MWGGGTETTTQTSGSTNPMVDHTVTKLLTNLGNQVDQGTAVFNQSLYPGLSNETRAGVGNLWSSATNNAGGLGSAYDWAKGAVASGGLDSSQRNAMNQTQEVGNQFGSIAGELSSPSYAERAFKDIYDTGWGPSLTESTLMNVAQGGAFGTNDPGYARMRQGALDDALTGVGSSFLTDGRFGSSIMGDAAGEAATETLAGLDYANFQNDQQRQMAALSAIEGQRQQGANNRAAALSASDAARLNQAGARMSALGAQGGVAQNQFAMGQQGFANAAGAAASIPSFYSAMQLPAQTQLGIGQLLDADSLAARQADYDLFRRQNDSGWATLGNASSILAGTAGSSGQQQSVTTPTTPWWQSALGLGISAAGAFL